jgi:hypothetical protein
MLFRYCADARIGESSDEFRSRVRASQWAHETLPHQALDTGRGRQHAVRPGAQAVALCVARDAADRSHAGLRDGGGVSSHWLDKLRVFRFWVPFEAGRGTRRVRHRLVPSGRGRPSGCRQGCRRRRRCAKRRALDQNRRKLNGAAQLAVPHAVLLSPHRIEPRTYSFRFGARRSLLR